MKTVKSLNYDIFTVCETFLRESSTPFQEGFKWIGNNRKNIHVKAKRGSGGVGIFIKNEFLENHKVQIIDDKYDDILWIKVQLNKERDLYLCVCYLPPENTTRIIDSEEFFNRLMESVYTYQNQGNICIVGDFNARLGDTADYIEGADNISPRVNIDDGDNKHGNQLVNFLIDTNMCVLNGRLGTDNFTHISHRGRSVVDYVLVPHEQLQFYTDFNVKTMSDTMDELNLRGYDCVPDHSILHWTIQSNDNIAEKECESNGTQNKEEKKRYNLSSIPSDFLSGEVYRVDITTTIQKIEHDIDHLCDINQAYSDFSKFIISQMDKHIGRKVAKNTQHRNKKSLYKPYWNHDLEQQCNLTREKERDWLKCNGNAATRRKLKSVYLQERKQFDRLNRKAKRQYQLKEQSKLLALHSENRSRELWREIGKLGMANDRTARIPMTVKDSNGDVVSEVDEVLDLWKTSYETLYNGTTTTNSFDDTHLEMVKERLRDGAIGPGRPLDTSILNAEITREEVKSAIFRAKLRKAPGFDNIPADVLRNDTCIDILLRIFTYCFINGVTPRDWSAGVIQPIPKSDSKDPTDPLSYRGISLLSIPCKIYTDVLGQRLNKWLEMHDVLVDEQNGFRRKRSCIDHIYSLYSIVNNRKLKKLPTFVCFVDIRKAFDTVNRDCLWYKLYAIGIQGAFMEAVKSLYSDVKCAVRLNNYVTDWFSVTHGVKQGCNISPALFSIYVNDLASDIKDLQCGVKFDDNIISLLMYADDIALLAANEHSLQCMLQCLNSWCEKWRLVINEEKTKIIHFRNPSSPRSPYKFLCGDSFISYADRYRYLGFWFTEHLDLSVSVRELAKSANRALSAIITKSKFAGGMSLAVFKQLYTSLVEPVLFYCSGIWGHNKYNFVQIVQNRACRYFLGTGKNGSNIAARGDLGWNSCDVNQKLEVCRLWAKLKLSDSNRLLSKIHIWSVSVNRSWENKVLILFRNIGLDRFISDTQLTCLKKCMNSIKNHLINIDNCKWLEELFNDRNCNNGNKLRTYRLYKTSNHTELYASNIMDFRHRQALAKFRSGNLKLNIETGRYSRPKVPLEDRLCTFCDLNCVEDECHFLITCDFYSDIRFHLFTLAEQSCPGFNYLDNVQKLQFLMNEPNLQYVLASTVHKMYRRRLRF